MRNAIRVFAAPVASLVATAACSAPRASSTPTPAATPSFTRRRSTSAPAAPARSIWCTAQGLAELLNKELGTAASAQSTTASVENMKLIRDGKADSGKRLALFLLEGAVLMFAIAL